MTSRLTTVAVKEEAVETTVTNVMEIVIIIETTEIMLIKGIKIILNITVTITLTRIYSLVKISLLFMSKKAVQPLKNVICSQNVAQLFSAILDLILN